MRPDAPVLEPLEARTLLATARIADHVENARPSQLFIDPKADNVLVTGVNYPLNDPPIPARGLLQAKGDADLVLATYTPDLAFVSASGGASLDTLGNYFPSGGFFVTAHAAADSLELYSDPETTLNLAGRTFILGVD
ncbi:MAG TPA: hypothetical protein VH475_16820 [Tepidisphaeraceae bacterium]|jgi:hypothetical protein